MVKETYYIKQKLVELQVSRTFKWIVISGILKANYENIFTEVKVITSLKWLVSNEKSKLGVLLPHTKT